MKKYIRSAVIDNRSARSATSSSKPRVTREQVQENFEKGVAMSKFAGHEITHYRFYKSGWYSGYIIEYMLSDCTYKYTNSYPSIFATTLYTFTPEYIADELNKTSTLVATDLLDVRKTEVDQAEQDLNEVVQECMDTHDVVGTVTYMSTNDAYSDSVGVSVEISKIGDLTRHLRDSFIWWLDRSYDENRDRIIEKFKKLIEPIRFKYNMMELDEKLKVAQSNLDNWASKFETHHSSSGVQISNPQVSIDNNNKILYTFDVSAYNGAADMTLQYSEDEFNTYDYINKNLMALLRRNR